MPNDNSLKRPPVKPTKDEDAVVEYLFDSVTGEMDGSQVFMIYENARAIPEYLVSYLVPD